MGRTITTASGTNLGQGSWSPALWGWASQQGPWTMSAWYRPAAFTQAACLISLGKNTIFNGYAGIRVNTGGTASVFHRGSSNITVSCGNADTTTGVWRHVYGTVNNSSTTDSFVVIQDGDVANKGSASNGASFIDADANDVRIGQVTYATADTWKADGDIAWVAVWNVWTGDRPWVAAALAAGVNPLTILPEHLIMCFPLTGASSGSEVDLITGQTLNENGTIGTSDSPLVSISEPWMVNYSEDPKITVRPFLTKPISRNSRIFMPTIAGDTFVPVSEPSPIQYKITMII